MSNIDKGTWTRGLSSDPTQILIKFQFQNLALALTSKSQPNLIFSTKLKLKFLTKPSFRILTKIQLRNLNQTSAANTNQTSASKSRLNFNFKISLKH